MFTHIMWRFLGHNIDRYGRFPRTPVVVSAHTARLFYLGPGGLPSLKSAVPFVWSSHHS